MAPRCKEELRSCLVEGERVGSIVVLGKRCVESWSISIFARTTVIGEIGSVTTGTVIGNANRRVAQIQVYIVTQVQDPVLTEITRVVRQAVVVRLNVQV